MTVPSVIASSIKRPGTYIQVSLGVGTRSAGDVPIKVLLYGNKTSAGSVATDTALPVYTPEDVEGYAGARSELYGMAVRAFNANPSISLSIIAVPESAGASATETIVFSGTATAEGTVTVWIGNWGKVTVAIAVGDAAATVATNVAAAITAKTYWPVTASPSTGTVTVTAAQKGPRGNYTAIRALQENGAGITMTPPSGAYLSGGTTMDDPTAALAAVSPTRYHFHVTPYQTATELALFKSHMNTHAAPLVGRRQRWVAGSIDTLSNSITLSDTINHVRGEIAWHYNGLDTPGEIAAAYGATLSLYNGIRRSWNYDDQVVTGLVPQVSSADEPTDNEIESALNAGLTPLYSNSGEIAIVRRITNYHLDSGSNPDYSVLDGHKVDVPDFIADDLQGSFRSTYPSALIGPDVEGQDPPVDVVTPSMIKDWIYGRLRTHEAGRLLKNGSVAARVEELLVEIDPVTIGRVNCTVPVDVVDLLHQGSMDVRQVG